MLTDSVIRFQEYFGNLPGISWKFAADVRTSIFLPRLPMLTQRQPSSALGSRDASMTRHTRQVALPIETQASEYVPAQN
jgi:hypothetical protein